MKQSPISNGFPLGSPNKQYVPVITTVKWKDDDDDDDDDDDTHYLIAFLRRSHSLQTGAASCQ